MTIEKLREGQELVDQIEDIKRFRDTLDAGIPHAAASHSKYADGTADARASILSSLRFFLAKKVADELDRLELALNDL